jgi:hypothetical protein
MLTDQPMPQAVRGQWAWYQRIPARKNSLIISRVVVLSPQGSLHPARAQRGENGQSSREASGRLSACAEGAKFGDRRRGLSGTGVALSVGEKISDWAESPIGAAVENGGKVTAAVKSGKLGTGRFVIGSGPIDEQTARDFLQLLII